MPLSMEDLYMSRFGKLTLVCTKNVSNNCVRVGHPCEFSINSAVTCQQCYREMSQKRQKIIRERGKPLKKAK